MVYDGHIRIPGYGRHDMPVFFGGWIVESYFKSLGFRSLRGFKISSWDLRRLYEARFILLSNRKPLTSPTAFVSTSASRSRPRRVQE